MQGDLKVLVVGPPKSGKTEIADILSAASKGFQGNCRPTIGIRILEFATQISVRGLETNISVQLWDTSGEEKYQMAWPAIAKNADGVILVYNAVDKVSARATETYVKAFAKDMAPNQLFLVAHRMGGSEKPIRPKLAPKFEAVKPIIVNAQEGLEALNDPFAGFLASVCQARIERIEEDERKLVGAGAQPEAAPPPKKPRPKRPVEDVVEGEGGDE
jgi:Rab-like protein 5